MGSGLAMGSGLSIGLGLGLGLWFANAIGVGLYAGDIQSRCCLVHKAHLIQVRVRARVRVRVRLRVSVGRSLRV